MFHSCFSFLQDVEAESANDRNEVFNTFEEGTSFEVLFLFHFHVCLLPKDIQAMSFRICIITSIIYSLSYWWPVGDAKKQLQEMVVPQSSSISSEIIDAPTTVSPTNDELLIELQRRARSDEIMRNFSKALWTVLKQYKQKLIVLITTLVFPHISILCDTLV